MSPTITVVIPTRDRADTLRHCLATVASQNCHGLDIIVSDNCSYDDTADVVRSFDDPRIRYIRTPARISMAENWEFAFQHVRTEYVTYLGDDDGFVDGALQALVNICERYQPDAIRWNTGSYRWPNVEPATFPMVSASGALSYKLLDVQNDVVRNRWRTGRLRWNFVPCVYGGVVRTSHLQRFRGADGKIWQSDVPDVYTAALLVETVESFLYTPASLSIFGYSRKSAAAAYHQGDSIVSPGSALAALIEEDARPAHPLFGKPFLKNDRAPMLECILRVEDIIGRPFPWWLLAFWYALISRDLGRRYYDPYRSTAFDELASTAPDFVIKAGVRLANLVWRPITSSPSPDLLRPTRYHTISEACDAYTNYRLKSGVSLPLEITDRLSGARDFDRFIAATQDAQRFEEPG